jgi:hypothetical protein
MVINMAEENEVQTYAIVENGIVTNLILWDGQNDWAPQEGSTPYVVLEGTVCEIGYTTADGVTYTAPVETPAAD